MTRSWFSPCKTSNKSSPLGLSFDCTPGVADGAFVFADTNYTTLWWRKQQARLAASGVPTSSPLNKEIPLGRTAANEAFREPW